MSTATATVRGLALKVSIPYVERRDTPDVTPYGERTKYPQ